MQWDKERHSPVNDSTLNETKTSELNVCVTYDYLQRDTIILLLDYNDQASFKAIHRCGHIIASLSIAMTSQWQIKTHHFINLKLQASITTFVIINKDDEFADFNSLLMW